MNLELKMAILRSGRNQSDIARDAGIFESRLSKIVHGYKIPTQVEQQQLAEVLGLNISILFSNYMQEIERKNGKGNGYNLKK